MSILNGINPFGKRSRANSAMHKVQFSRGISVQKEFWRSNTLPSFTRSRVGCFARLHMQEENARFILSALFVIAYLLFGAYIFHVIERPNELIERENYAQIFGNFSLLYCQNGLVNCTMLEHLLNLRGNLSAAGLMSDRPKWDFAGAFYFVGTIISTIGFGMTVPRTTFGRIAVICYGFFGCASCILFFNLFLERIVTALAYFLRYLHNKKVKMRWNRQRKDKYGNSLTVDSVDLEESSSIGNGPVTANWKPSLYKVFLCLFTVSAVLMTSAAAMFSYVENWTFFEGFYFTFVSFATIGFGDYVSSQQSNSTKFIIIYRIFNFIFLSLGCCCLYSLSNVTSVVIRQILNWIIKKLDVHCQPRQKKRRRYMGLGLRPPPSDDISETTPPEGLISLKEFLQQNQARMLLVQKQLIQSANRTIVEVEEPKISASNVGPLAILTQKFGED